MIVKPIATHVITGFLGVGKTSFIKYLLANKPSDEVWAILVNEFGEIGIDVGLIDNQSGQVTIKEVAGGCLCCAAGVPTQVAVNQLIAKAKPDRLLIEPTGLGHPKAIIETLMQPHFQQVIALKSSICLVDARKVSDSRYRQNDTFNQQLAIADLILATKTDLLEQNDLTNLHRYLEAKSIDKQVVAVSLLDKPVQVEQTELFEWLSTHYLQRASAMVSFSGLAAETMPESLFRSSPLQAAPEQQSVSFDPQGVYRSGNKIDDIYSAGWVFDCYYEFDFTALLSWVKAQHCLRLKAVVICDEGIAGLNYVDEQLSVIELDDAMDSRIELISEQPINLVEMEQQLMMLSKRVVL
ncbi:CobW family GTP-binding protein [Shewanella psychrotolerans]|uniref:CobW family GTP-binding protein n=1 Tax=Shewanella psychrotolerans TaxID=2864206 RepID=UPI001C655D65|nr:GTP-binding protein [Shewanella psychrotolerans]QYK00454.1 GTP-binding protein [Shewanella psychrotolerans]